MHVFSAWIMRKTGKRLKKIANGRELENNQSIEEYVDADSGMAQTNGMHRETTPIDTSIVPPGRVISTSMMRQGQRTVLGRANGI